MQYFSDPVLKVLSAAGWQADRNIFHKLTLPSKKKLFRNAKEIIEKLGLLEIEFIGRSGHEIIYFDVDDSIVSMNMRARIFGYDNYQRPLLKNEPDYEAKENFKWVEKAEEYVNMPLSRIGFLEDEFGYNIYVGENGYIYVAHSEEPVLASLNYIDFLNSTILSANL